MSTPFLQKATTNLTIIDLLKRYIDHVCKEEGTTFISSFEGEGKEILVAIQEELYPYNPDAPTTLERSPEYSKEVKLALWDDLGAIKTSTLRRMPRQAH
ncbi:MAG TPA: hypothetical protein VEP90_08890 [Methylomirabilota bacterium]|nr:hypothetical protein [Methylomirabilota bacterium]